LWKTDHDQLSPHIYASLLLPLLVIFFLPIQLFVKGTDLLYTPSSELHSLLTAVIIWGLLFISLALILKRIVRRSKKITVSIQSALHRLTPLAIIYLGFDLASLLLVILRNLR
jgi:hypothetical protein